MSDNHNALAELGLDLGGDEASETEVAQSNVGNASEANQQAPIDVDTAEDTAEAVKTRSPVEVVVSDAEDFEELMPSKRGAGRQKTGESKYPFASLAEPQERDGKFVYTPFTVTAGEGEDFDRVRASVNSAVSVANREAKESGETGTYGAARYVTRSATVGDKPAIKVYRVDNTLDKTEAASA